MGAMVVVMSLGFMGSASAGTAFTGSNVSVGLLALGALLIVAAK